MELCLEKEHLEAVQRILGAHFAGLEVDAYGPRVTGVDLTPETTLNVAVVSDKPIPVEEMLNVEKAFADRGLPFRVDVIDWAKLTENMQKSIRKEHVVIQEAAPDEN